MPGRLAFLITAYFLQGSFVYSQNDSSVQLQQLPSKYVVTIFSKANSLEQKFDKKSGKALQQLQKLEAKMKRKLKKVDSTAVNNVFANADTKYKELAQKIQNTKLKQYIPRLDSLSTSLKFLENNPALLSKVKEGKEKLQDALSKMKGLEGQLHKAEELKKFLKERKQFLKDQLSRFGFARDLKRLNKQVYYYAQQVNEYKEVLNNPKKIEKKVLELLSKTKAWKEFFARNSVLASLFRLPGDSNDPAAQPNLAGLQTRAQVNNLIQQQLAAGGPNAQQQFRQNLQDAQTQLSSLKDKILKTGGSNSADEIPEGFKPNNQKSKGFFQRLELGTNVQTQKASDYFPVTSDIGLSLGYKLNDRSVIGIGTSYKVGWGRGWNDINITQQGVGLRTFIDWKIKGSFWISGGYEQNYNTGFSNLSQLQNISNWRQSGLIGLSKVISLKSKLFKKTSVKLLWDFLSYRQVPRVQPIVFRIGYSLN